MNTIIKECSKCDKVTEVKETPSGFEVCRECAEKYNVDFQEVQK